jgi:hypothetical protein
MHAMSDFNESAGKWHVTSRKRRRKRLPWSGTHGAPKKWDPTEEDWFRLQNAYGKTFDATLRAAIERAVTEYFLWAPFEDAPFVDDCIRDHAKATSLAKELGKVIHSLGGARSMVARHWKRYFPPEDERRDHREFSQVVHILHSALAAALRDIKSPDLPAFSEGDAWERLVLDIANEFRQRGCKATASKNSICSQSPFVRFVGELQDTFKGRSLRRHPTPDALSGAVSLALRKAKNGKISSAAGADNIPTTAT